MSEIMVVGSGKIVYQPLKNWKYRTVHTYCMYVPFSPPSNITIDFNQSPMIVFNTDGSLTVYAGYCWDGPSGPTVDSKNFMRGSLVHDVMYQMMRAGKLPSDYKDKADRLLEAMCKEDGMSSFRAWYVYWGVRIGGASACKPGYDVFNEYIVAP